jgi:hypothetical protein
MDIVVFLMSVAGVIAAFFSVVLVGGWLDRRASSERHQAMDDLEQYGPLAPGLRTDLLPPDRQAEVRDARKRAGIG